MSCAGADPTYATFLSQPVEDEVAMVQRNGIATLRLCHHFAGPMQARGSGAIVLVSSGAGLVGGPNMVAYGATKAFDMVMAEALWAELHGAGVDVLGLVLGLTDTPAAVERVAAQLQAAFNAGPDEAQAVLRALYADEVELRHVPALPSDGIVDGARLRDASGREAAAVKGAIPDLHYAGVEVTVDGARVHVTAWIEGTLATGSTVHLLSDMSCTVRDDRIVGMEHRMDNATMAGWVEVAAAGGLSVPASYVDEA